MESQRLILFFVFSFAVFLLLDAWQRDQKPPPAPTAAADAESKGTAAGTPAVVPTPTPGEKLAATQAAIPKEGAAPRAPGATIRVETDLVIADLNTVGGDLRRLELKPYTHYLPFKTMSFFQI